MSKYIKADEIIKTIQELKDGTNEWDEGIQIGLNSAIHLVENYPSADVRENIHGEWKEGKNRQQCSECLYRGFKSYNFCPNCGADMRGDTECRNT